MAMKRLVPVLAFLALAAALFGDGFWKYYIRNGIIYLVKVGGTYGEQSGIFTVNPETKKWMKLPDVFKGQNPFSPSDEVALQNLPPGSVPPPPSGSSRKAAVSPSGNLLYTTDRVTSRVLQIDMSTGTQLKQATLSGLPVGIALSPDGKTLYAAATPGYAQPNQPSYLAMIDTATFQVTNIPLPAMSFPDYVAVAPDGSAVYVSGEGFTNFVNGKDQIVAASALYVVDPVKRAVASTLALPHQLSQGASDGRLAISPDGTTLVAMDVSSMLVIDTLTLTISKSIDVLQFGSFPAPHMAFSPDGAFLYVSAYADYGNTRITGAPVTRFDAQTWKIANAFYFGADSNSFHLGDLALSLDGATLFVTDKDDGSTNLYDSSTGQLIQSFPGDGHPEESMLLAPAY